MYAPEKSLHSTSWFTPTASARSERTSAFLKWLNSQRSTPFTLVFESQDAFLKGERIQILAGANPLMEGYINDMKAVMAAFTVWQVKSLAIYIRA